MTQIFSELNSFCARFGDYVVQGLTNLSSLIQIFFSIIINWKRIKTHL